MKLFRAYLPVFLWMLVIFAASTGVGSVQNTSRIIGPLLRLFIPGVTPETIHQVQVFVRKGAHLTEYALLAMLIWRSRRQALNEKAVWYWKEYPVILGFCAFYAATDELHQYYVASRQASPFDVLIDSLGAALGLLVIWALVCRRGHSPKEEST